MDTQVINDTMAAWRENPDQARGTPTITARAADAQAAIQAGPFTWRADLPAPLGGTNQAPSPTALLLGALAGCAVVFIRDTLGPQLGTKINAVDATVSCTTDARGLLGMDDARPDLANVSLDISIDSPDGQSAVDELARVWRERCPVYLALINPTEVEVSFKEATDHV